MQRTNRNALAGRTAQGADTAQQRHPNIITLLDRLDKVKQTAGDRWLACCPAHQDRTPSLSIRETTDGTILIRCWAGCTAADIVESVGLELRDLFPPLPAGAHFRRPARHRIPAADRIAAIDHEALVVAVIADDMAKGKPLTDDVRDRLHVAAQRIGEARE